MGLNHIAIISIPVKDQQLSKAFYIDKMGFDIVRENPMGPNQTWVQLGLPNQKTSITLVSWFDSMPPGCQQGLVLDCSDIEATRADFIKSGAKVSDIESAPWAKWFTLSDVDGNGWVIQEAAKD